MRKLNWLLNGLNQLAPVRASIKNENRVCAMKFIIGMREDRNQMQSTITPLELNWTVLWY